MVHQLLIVMVILYDIRGMPQRKGNLPGGRGKHLLSFLGQLCDIVRGVSSV